MFRLLLLAAALGAAVTAAPVRAAPLPGLFSSFFVFGDSLSDTGNAFAATGAVLPVAVPPSPPYFNGRVSNGPVWNEAIAASFAAAGRPTGNFAFAAATALGDLTLTIGGVTGTVPGFGSQIAAFQGSVPPALLGPDALASAWFGANDLFLAVDSGADAATVGLVGAAAANAVALGVGQLAAGGVGNILLFNLPDLGRTPAYAGTAEAFAASAGTAAFNATLAARAAALRAGGVNVIEVDIAAFFDAMFANPAAFGLTDVTIPCITGSVLTVTAVCADPLAPGRAFYDEVHPTAQVHALIGGVAEAAVAPVPLPGALPLLAAALGGLVLVRRRA